MNRAERKKRKLRGMGGNDMEWRAGKWNEAK